MPTANKIDSGGRLTAAQEATIASFMREACVCMSGRYRPDCCIAATRITVDALRGLGFQVEPVVVHCQVFNAVYWNWLLAHGRWPADMEEAQALVDAGAHSVDIGNPRDQQQPGGWVGHLVALVEGCLLIDLSLGQATRPAKQMYLPPIAAMIADGFATGTPDDFEMNGCRVRYEPRPGVTSYTASKDWSIPARHAPVLRAIRNRMKRGSKRT